MSDEIAETVSATGQLPPSVNNRISLCDVIKFAHDIDKESISDIVFSIIKQGSVDMLETLKEHNITFSESVLNYAMSMPNDNDIAITPVIRWLLDNGYEYNSYSINSAIDSCVASRVKMLLDVGYLVDSKYVEEAIRNGNKVLRVLFGHGYEICNKLGTYPKCHKVDGRPKCAIDLEAVKFMHEKLKFPITSETFDIVCAICNDDVVDTFQYLYGIAPDVCSEYLRKAALQRGWITDNNSEDRIKLAELNKQLNALHIQISELGQRIRERSQ
jgi:hypothetical protein